MDQTIHVLFFSIQTFQEFSVNRYQQL